MTATTSARRAPSAAARGFNLGDAITRGLDQSLAEDERVMLFGEDVGKLGGVFRISRGLQDKYGEDRVFDTPLSEAGIVGMSVGLALNGFRPIVEIQFDGFMFPAMNQICTHVARYPFRVGEPDALPLVIRIPVGGRFGGIELHSENPEAYFCHTPDLRVVAASQIETAQALLVAATRLAEPVIFLEPKRLYRRGRASEASRITDVALDKARMIREGGDVLIVTYGPSVPFALDAADAAEQQFGVSVGVLDLVSLAPIDEAAVLAAAAATGRVLVLTESIRRCSVASEVTALISTEVFSELKRPVRVLSSPNAPTPLAIDEDAYFPSPNEILTAVKELAP
jgi:pyruvate dehydrogenase E1 component beta subunit